MVQPVPRADDLSTRNLWVRILQLLGYTSGGLPDDFDEPGEGESEDPI